MPIITPAPDENLMTASGLISHGLVINASPEVRLYTIGGLVTQPDTQLNGRVVGWPTLSNLVLRMRSEAPLQLTAAEGEFTLTGNLALWGQPQISDDGLRVWVPSYTEFPTRAARLNYYNLAGQVAGASVAPTATYTLAASTTNATGVVVARCFTLSALAPDESALFIFDGGGGAYPSGAVVTHHRITRINLATGAESQTTHLTSANGPYCASNSARRIGGLCVSADGTRLFATYAGITTGTTNNIAVYNASSLALVTTVLSLANRVITGLALSRDGAHLAAVTGTTLSLHVLSIDTSADAYSVVHTASYSSPFAAAFHVAYSLDNKRLYVCLWNGNTLASSQNGYIKVLDVTNSYSQINQVNHYTGMETGFSHLAVSVWEGEVLHGDSLIDRALGLITASPETSAGTKQVKFYFGERITGIRTVTARAVLNNTRGPSLSTKDGDIYCLAKKTTGTLAWTWYRSTNRAVSFTEIAPMIAPWTTAEKYAGHCRGQGNIIFAVAVVTAGAVHTLKCRWSSDEGLTWLPAGGVANAVTIGTLTAAAPVFIKSERVARGAKLLAGLVTQATGKVWESQTSGRSWAA